MKNLLLCLLVCVGLSGCVVRAEPVYYPPYPGYYGWYHGVYYYGGSGYWRPVPHYYYREYHGWHGGRR